MFDLYFKHLYPSFPEWQEDPFSPWIFGEGVLLTVLSFFEKDLEDSFSLRDILKCEIFMDSGAFSAAAMGFSLDPYEVAEMQALLKADLVVPLDLVITLEDSLDEADQKVAETIRNTEILLDFLPAGSEIIGPLQGLTPELIERMFTEFLNLGVKKFALGGVVFQDIKQALERIKIARDITKGYNLHVFGKFLHPKLLKPVMRLCDSVDGYGYILSSVKGLYIHKREYKAIAGINDDQLAECSCTACRDHSLLDFQRADREAQYLIIKHNISALIALKEQYAREILKENKEF
ncbi:MAG: tRNA-guanine transglycosylase [Candidatus Odinarchaeota archaeon]